MGEECELKSICRICLTENGNLRSVFLMDESTDLTIHISEMICAFSSVQITLGDGLPEQICSSCAEQTVSTYLFKLKCEESDSILRRQLLKSPEQTKEREEESIENCITYEEETKPETNEAPKSQEQVFEDFIDFSYMDNNTDSEQDISENDAADNLILKKIEKLKEFECEICLKRFSRQDLLLRHKIAHAMKMYDEKIEFDGTFSMNDVSDDAIIIKTEDVLYSCHHCNSIFMNKEDLDSHLEEHTKDGVGLVCELCFKKFSKPSHLNRHLKTHSSVKTHTCPQCNKGFVRPEQLNNHMNSHSGAKPHTCDICFKGFNQISNLKDHMRTHNGEKPFLCSTCGKGFNQLGNLRQHTIRHTGIKAHLCSTCGNGFASKGELSAHLRKHTGARPFVCPVCSHGFTTSSSLTKHKRIHSGEKPYECDVCHMKFSRSGILARHKRTHTGEKPYVCKYCAKAFSQSNDLTSHLRIHTGEKPYICDECGQAFRQTSALKTHKKTHVGDVDKKFSINKPLIMHSTLLATIQ